MVKRVCVRACVVCRPWRAAADDAQDRLCSMPPALPIPPPLYARRFLARQ
jgi:hypothetical protein